MKIMKIILCMCMISRFAYSAEVKSSEAPAALVGSSVVSELLNQMLNSMSEVSADFQINNLTLDSEVAQSQRDMTSTVQTIFDANWSVKLLDTSNQNNDSDSNRKIMDKVTPVISTDSQGLLAQLDYSERQNATQKSQLARLILKDSKNGQQKPLTVQVSTLMNKNLLQIKLYSAQISIIDGVVLGTCEADKFLTDIQTGHKQRKSVICRLTGTYQENKYNLSVQFKDAIAKSTSIVNP